MSVQAWLVIGVISSGNWHDKRDSTCSFDGCRSMNTTGHYKERRRTPKMLVSFLVMTSFTISNQIAFNLSWHDKNGTCVHSYNSIVQLMLPIHLSTHTATAIGYHARHQPAHQDQLGVRFLAQGHFDTPREGIEPATLWLPEGCSHHLEPHVRCILWCNSRAQMHSSPSRGVSSQ